MKCKGSSAYRTSVYKVYRSSEYILMGISQNHSEVWAEDSRCLSFCPIMEELYYRKLSIGKTNNEQEVLRDGTKCSDFLIHNSRM